MKTLKLNGVVFEVIQPRKNVLHSADFDYRYTGRNISDCYAKPSRIKEIIYYGWRDWSRECIKRELAEIRGFGVSSYNSMQFTISFLAFIQGEWYVATITRDHNRLTKCID